MVVWIAAVAVIIGFVGAPLIHLIRWGAASVCGR
jgi:hypothetical protein